MRIAVYQNGVCVGWIRSVSVYRYKFYITQDKTKAKKYGSNDQAMSEIDLCTRFQGGNAYGFMIDNSN